MSTVLKKKGQADSLNEKSGNVIVEGDSVEVTLPGESVRLSLTQLPRTYVKWMNEGRRKMYDSLLNMTPPSFFPQHLPVVVTYSKDALFPFNCGNKGVGYLPKNEYLTDFIDLFRTVMDRTRAKPWEESLEERIEAVSKLYFDSDKVDHRALTSLEIFERKTYKNLKTTPLASLLYTGQYPRYTSFQLNCAVEVIGQDDPRHTFIMLARTMFEYDSFHIAQPQFPQAYIFWITEVLNKTPFQVKAQKDSVPHNKFEGSMQWEQEALEAIGRAPGMLQGHIRKAIEEFARRRGYPEITLALVHEAKENLM